MSDYQEGDFISYEIKGIRYTGVIAVIAQGYEKLAYVVEPEGKIDSVDIIYTENIIALLK